MDTVLFGHVIESKLADTLRAAFLVFFKHIGDKFEHLPATDRVDLHKVFLVVKFAVSLFLKNYYFSL